MKVHGRSSAAIEKGKCLGGGEGVVWLQVPYHANVKCCRQEKVHRGQLRREVFGLSSQEKNKHVAVSFTNRACLLLSHCRTINFLSK